MHVQYIVQLMNEKLYLFIYYYCDTTVLYYFLQPTVQNPKSTWTFAWKTINRSSKSDGYNIKLYLKISLADFNSISISSTHIIVSVSLLQHGHETLW